MHPREYYFADGESWHTHPPVATWTHRPTLTQLHTLTPQARIMPSVAHLHFSSHRIPSRTHALISPHTLCGMSSNHVLRISH